MGTNIGNYYHPVYAGMYGWFLALSFFVMRTACEGPDVSIIKSLQKVEVVEVQTIDLSKQDWSAWGECSHTCGGCGVQNRSVSLPNSTNVLHVRHCNIIPCSDGQEPCCKPYKFRKGKCIAPKESESAGAPIFTVIQNDTNTGLAFAGNGTAQELDTLFGPNTNATTDGPDLETLFGETTGNATGTIGTDVNRTGLVAASKLPSSSSEYSEEIEQGAIDTSLKPIDLDILRDPKRKGALRKRRRQRRPHRDPSAQAAAGTENRTGSEQAKKEFDAFFFPDYYDYYYYYYY